MASSLPDSNNTTVSVPLWVDGKEELGSTTFDIINPASNTPCWCAASATADDARRAVESAEKASVTWSQTKPAQRMEILLKTAANLEKSSVEYAGYMVTEMGTEMRVAQSFMLPLALSMLRDIAGRTVSICGSVPHCQQDGQSAMVFKEPYGVTLGIVPWSVHGCSHRGRD
jgi:acyl-CoA reductase-like NAD-dependent aldehyde dehydrogenase